MCFCFVFLFSSQNQIVVMITSVLPCLDEHVVVYFPGDGNRKRGAQPRPAVAQSADFKCSET